MSERRHSLATREHPARERGPRRGPRLMAAIFKVVLTGGPGGGKSSSLARLRRELGPQGFQVQPFPSGRRGCYVSVGRGWAHCVDIARTR